MFTAHPNVRSHQQLKSPTFSLPRFKSSKNSYRLHQFTSVLNIQTHLKSLCISCMDSDKRKIRPNRIHTQSQILKHQQFKIITRIHLLDYVKRLEIIPQSTSQPLSNIQTYKKLKSSTFLFTTEGQRGFPASPTIFAVVPECTVANCTITKIT